MKLLPRLMRDISHIDMTCRLLGRWMLLFARSQFIQYALGWRLSPEQGLFLRNHWGRKLFRGMFAMKCSNTGRSARNTVTQTRMFCFISASDAVEARVREYQYRRVAIRQRY